MRGNDEGGAEVARGLLHFSVMRSLLALFVMAALGFAIVLKKDNPQPVAPPKVAHSPKQKMRPRFDEPIALTHVAVNERERTSLR